MPPGPGGRCVFYVWAIALLFADADVENSTIILSCMATIHELVGTVFSDIVVDVSVVCWNYTCCIVLTFMHFCLNLGHSCLDMGMYAYMGEDLSVSMPIVEFNIL